MKKVALILVFACSLFIIHACGGGGGGGGGSATPLKVSSLESAYKIGPMQRNGEGATTVGIKVNPATMSGINVSLSDGMGTDLALEPLGDSPIHSENTICASCHNDVADSERAGATYFTNCYLADSDTIVCGDGTEFDVANMKLSATYDNGAAIAGSEGLDEITFDVGDYKAPTGLPVTEINAPNLDGSSDPSPRDISLVVDASNYPSNEYGNIGVVLDADENYGTTGDQVIAKVTDNPENANEVIATVQCYLQGSDMICRTPGGSYNTSALFPVPLTGGEIFIGTNADASGKPSATPAPSNPSNDGAALDNLLDSGISSTPYNPSDPTTIIITPISGATIPLQERDGAVTPVNVAKVTDGSDTAFTATLGGTTIPITGTTTRSIACMVTSSTTINCGSGDIAATAGNPIQLVVSANGTPILTTNIATASFDSAMPMMMHVDSGSIPMSSLLLFSESATLRFVVDITNTEPGSTITCGMTKLEGGLLTGLVGGLLADVSNLLDGANSILFTAQTPSNTSTTMSLTTTCTYNPGVLGALSSINCTNTTTNMSNLLGLLTDNDFVAFCTDTTTGSGVVGQSVPFKLTSSLLDL